MAARAFLLGYNTTGFSRTRDLLRILETIRAIGFEAAEITLDPKHLHPLQHPTSYWNVIRSRAETLGLPLAIGAGGRYTLGTIPHRPSLCSPDALERKDRRDFLLAAVELTAAVGASTIVLHSGPPTPNGKEPDDWNRLVAGLGPVCDAAQKRGVAVAFEFHPAMLIRDLAGYRALKRVLPRPALALNLDVGHVQCTEDRPIPEVLAEALPETAHIHLEDIRGKVHKHLPIGDGDVPFTDVFRSLSGLGYTKLVCAEFHSGEIAMPEEELARTTFERLQSCLGG